MRVKKGFILEKTMQTYLVMDATGAFSGAIRLNKTSAAIWKAIEEGKTPEEAAHILTERFAVTPEIARRDTEAFCRDMIEKGFFEE